MLVGRVVATRSALGWAVLECQVIGCKAGASGSRQPKELQFLLFLPKLKWERALPYMCPHLIELQFLLLLLVDEYFCQLFVFVFFFGQGGENQHPEKPEMFQFC